MKNGVKNLSELAKMLILAGIVAFSLALLAIIPLIIWGQTGWLIGVAIGSVIEIINIILLYKGSEFMTKKGKPAFFLLFYFGRMALFLTGFLVTAMLGFGFKIAGNAYIPVVNAFVHSIWGVLIAYTPLQVVVIVVMLISKKSELSIRKGYK